MLKFLIFSFLLLFGNCWSERVQEQFVENEIFSDLKLSDVPLEPLKVIILRCLFKIKISFSLQIRYPSDVEVNLGNILTPSQVKQAPTVEYEADADGYYTLAMVDPDAPSRAEPKFREWEHWLVANIPGNDLSCGDILAIYVGSGPPKGTSLHRYIFLLFKQNGKYAIDEERLTTQ